MAYQQLTLRMIRMLVAIKHGWRLEHTTPLGYIWVGNAAMPDPGDVHWNTVLALCKRDLIHAVRTRQGLAYSLTDRGRLYLKERAARHDADHPPL